jgi:hypothetical protein
MNDASRFLYTAAAVIAFIGVDIAVIVHLRQTDAVAETNPFEQSGPTLDTLGHNPGHQIDAYGDAQELKAEGDNAEACIAHGGQPNYLENPKQYLNCYGHVVHGELGDTYEIIPPK